MDVNVISRYLCNRPRTIAFNTRYITVLSSVRTWERDRTEPAFRSIYIYDSRFLEIAAFPKRSDKNTHSETWIPSNYDHQISQASWNNRGKIYVYAIRIYEEVYIYIYIKERRKKKASFIRRRRRRSIARWNGLLFVRVRWPKYNLSTGAEIARYSCQRGGTCRRYMHT